MLTFVSLPGYQEILNEGKTLGLEQGLEQGERSLVLRQLNRKIGAIAPQIIAKIESLSLGKIDMLGEALLEFERIEDLENWLEQI